MPVKLSDRMSPHESVTYFFEQAAERVGLDDEMREVLRGSYREMKVQVQGSKKSVEFADATFGASFNEPLVHQVDLGHVHWVGKIPA